MPPVILFGSQGIPSASSALQNSATGRADDRRVHPHDEEEEAVLRALGDRLGNDAGDLLQPGDQPGAQRAPPLHDPLHLAQLGDRHRSLQLRHLVVRRQEIGVALPAVAEIALVDEQAHPLLDVVRGWSAPRRPSPW